VETSAKTGENVEEIFLMASKILYTNFKDKIGTLVSASEFFDFFRKNRQNRRKSKGRNNVKMYKQSHHAVAEP
jgi:GTPase SAR1 family protein